MPAGLPSGRGSCYRSPVRNGWFHHPDVSLRVFARRATTVLADAFTWYGDLLESRGRSAWRNQSYGSDRAYQAAVRRLRKQGVVTSRPRGGGAPLLRVSPLVPVEQAVRDPRPWWRERWAGYWYVLVYDVPEQNRRYRDHLRRLLMHHRCGCLQHSVWVSPRDLRALFDDLSTAAAVEDMAHLFEARTVLGRGSRRVVAEAWDFVAINGRHERFQRDAAAALVALRNGGLPPSAITALAREELQAYRAVIEQDPLLPKGLSPPDYAGHDSYAAHLRVVESVRRTGVAFS